MLLRTKWARSPSFEMYQSLGPAPCFIILTLISMIARIHIGCACHISRESHKNN
jgi:hypothetical protein